MHNDASNLSGLAPVNATLTVTNSEKTISDKLIGIFFEDISYAADGGLYAELIQNRDFEYVPKDHRGWNATTAWSASKPIVVVAVDPLSVNNPHYAVLGNDTIYNEGWDGIAVKAGAKYDFSMFVRNIPALEGKSKLKKDFIISLVTEDEQVIAQTKIKTQGDDWKPYQAVLTAKQTCDKTRLAITGLKEDKCGIDMVSLFPQETFMHRKNGLRQDLAQVIANLKPKFVRFPGGCMSHVPSDHCRTVSPTLTSGAITRHAVSASLNTSSSVKTSVQSLYPYWLLAFPVRTRPMIAMVSEVSKAASP